MMLTPNLKLGGEMKKLFSCLYGQGAIITQGT